MSLTTFRLLFQIRKRVQDENTSMSLIFCRGVEEVKKSLNVIFAILFVFFCIFCSVAESIVHLTIYSCGVENLAVGHG